MKFEWDDVKSDACFARRGFDFNYAARVFLHPDRLVAVDDRFDYGEPRYRVLGRIEGRLFLLVYTPRDGALRNDLGPQGQREGGGSLWARLE